MTPLPGTDWSKVRNVLVTIAAVLGFLLGLVNYIQGQIPVETLGVTNFSDIGLTGDLTAVNAIGTTAIRGTTVNATTTLSSGGVATVVGDATAANMIGTTAIRGTTINATTTLSIGAVSFSGVVKFGVVTGMTDGGLITHGFSSAPTACVVSANTPLTASVTSIGTTTAVVSVPDTATVYWMCGK